MGEFIAQKTRLLIYFKNKFELTRFNPKHIKKGPSFTNKI